MQFGKPSLACDLQESYRYPVDDFVIQFCKNTKEEDFITKTEELSRSKKSKREILNDVKTRELTNRLNKHFESNVEISRIEVGHKKTIEPLINEEALLSAEFLRDERETWKPRIAGLCSITA